MRSPAASALTDLRTGHLLDEEGTGSQHNLHHDARFLIPQAFDCLRRGYLAQEEDQMCFP
jgi:hypothetical protein